MSLSGVLIAVSIVVIVHFFRYLQSGSFEEYIENIKSVGLKGFLKILLRVAIIGGLIFLLEKFF